MRQLFARTFAAFATLSAVAITAPTFAQSTDALADAREKFGEARKLENAGDWARALDLFQVVAAVKTTPQVRFHVALCMEHLGLLTQALDGFTRAAEEANPSAPEVVREAQDHLKALETRIATVTVVAFGATPEDAIELDRRPIPAGDPPLPMRVDPGTHVAEVRRGSAIVARAFFVAEAQKPKRIALTVGTVATPPRETVTPSPAREPESASSRDLQTRRVLGFGLLGLGGVAAVMTGVFAGMRGGALADLEAQCPAQPTCPANADRPTIDAVVSRGKTYSALVDVFAGVTAVTVLGGVALVLTAPPGSPSSTPQSGQTGHAVSIIPTLSRTSGGLSLTGIL